MISDEEFMYICKTSKSMLEASKKINISFSTFKRRAEKLGCYQTNQSGKCMSKNRPSIPIKEILNGSHPDYQTFKLKNRLIKEYILPSKCGKCGISEQNDLPLSLELHHIDGTGTNHKRKNLILLCPNCHSQTINYRGSNKNKIDKKFISDEEFITALNKNKNIRQALISLNLKPMGDNYSRAKKLLNLTS